MANQDLLNYIRQARRNGEKDEEIRSSLSLNGWLAQDIEEGFREIDSPYFSKQTVNVATTDIKQQNRESSIIQPQIEDKAPGKNLKKILIIGGAVFMLAGVLAGFYFWNNLKRSDKEDNLSVKTESAGEKKESGEEQEKDIVSSSEIDDISEQKIDLEKETLGWQNLQFKKYGLSFKIPPDYKQIKYVDKEISDDLKSIPLEVAYKNNQGEEISFAVIKYGDKSISLLKKCDQAIVAGQSSSQPICILLPVNAIRSAGKRVQAEEIEVGDGVGYLYSTEMDGGRRIKYSDMYPSYNTGTVILFLFNYYGNSETQSDVVVETLNLKIP